MPRAAAAGPHRPCGATCQRKGSGPLKSPHPPVSFFLACSTTTTTTTTPQTALSRSASDLRTRRRAGPTARPASQAPSLLLRRRRLLPRSHAPPSLGAPTPRPFRRRRPRLPICQLAIPSLPPAQEWGPSCNSRTPAPPPPPHRLDASSLRRRCLSGELPALPRRRSAAASLLNHCTLG
jgi:hypothetical protein